MAIITDTAIKLTLETGDVPTQAQFADFVDSKVNINMEQSLYTESHSEIISKTGNITINTSQVLKDAYGNTIADSNGKLPKALAYSIIFG